VWFEEEVRRVRKLMFASLVACMLALMSLLSVSAVSGPCCGEALKCTIELELNPQPNGDEPDWDGAVDGDVQGIYQLRERWDEIFFTGPDVDFPTTEHYFENFVIETEDGRIEGVDQGVFNFVTLKFHYTGSVTVATGYWSYLEGWNLHGQGVVDLSGPVTATGTMALVPP
jgi:hypothetical protein